MTINWSLELSLKKVNSKDLFNKENVLMELPYSMRRKKDKFVFVLSNFK